MASMNEEIKDDYREKFRFGMIKNAIQRTNAVNYKCMRYKCYRRIEAGVIKRFMLFSEFEHRVLCRQSH